MSTIYKRFSRARGSAHRQAGFTLIELLVVIAIIGILAGIVLASLNSAREGANDAVVKEQLNALRTQAEIVYGVSGNQYGTAAPASATCPATVGSLPGNPDIAALVTAMPAGSTSYCGVAAALDAYAVSVSLSGTGAANDFWCVDSSGASRLVNIGVAPGVTVDTCAGMDAL